MAHDSHAQLIETDARTSRENVDKQIALKEQQLVQAKMGMNTQKDALQQEVNQLNLRLEARREDLETALQNRSAQKHEADTHMDELNAKHNAAKEITMKKISDAQGVLDDLDKQPGVLKQESEARLARQRQDYDLTMAVYKEKEEVVKQHQTELL